MKFRTELPLPSSDICLDIDHPVVLLGSCFAENIAARMRQCLWDASNPLGTLFNPVSIADALSLLLFSGDDARDKSVRDSIFCQNPTPSSPDRIFHTWLGGSLFSSASEDAVFAKILDAAATLRQKLSRARALFVTFGTARIYQLENQRTVANCHKQPASMFTTRRLSCDEIERLWIPAAEKLHDLFPELRIIFTVSPVRHLKDGFHENTLSKATLHLAIERVCDTFSYCRYFPAFELLDDDLRDYRFYGADLVHPSEEAVEYIWEKFLDAFVAPEARLQLRDGERLNRAFLHRPLIPSPAAEALRMKDLSRKASLFADSHPAALKPAPPLSFDSEPDDQP